jgi:hypothetical protein
MNQPVDVITRLLERTISLRIFAETPSIPYRIWRNARSPALINPADLRALISMTLDLVDASMMVPNRPLKKYLKGYEALPAEITMAIFAFCMRAVV